MLVEQLCHTNVPEEKVSKIAQKLSISCDALRALLKSFEKQVGACQDIVMSKDEIILYSNGEPYILTEGVQKALLV